MHGFWKLLAALVAAVSAFCATSSHAQSEIENGDDPWTHRIAEVTFPKTLGTFARTQIYEYSEDGSDASVSYRLETDDGILTMTIYVYPNQASYSCDESFEGARAHIVNYEGSRLVAEWSTLPPDGEGELAAKIARYFLPEGSVREELPALYSDLYLYCPPGEEWLVKYRASWSGEAQTFPDIGTMLAQVEWPAHLD